MNTSTQFRRLQSELARVSVKLKSLEQKLSRDPKKAVKRVRLLIDRFEVKAENEDELRTVHIEIMKVIEEVKDHQKDLDWEI